MSCNTNPIFTRTNLGGAAQISAANTNHDGTGTLVSVITGGVDGTRIDKFEVTAVGNTTAGMVRFFYYDGTNTRLIKEIPVTAVTVSATVAGWIGSWIMDVDRPLTLPSGHIIKASTHNAETFNIMPFGGHY